MNNNELEYNFLNDTQTQKQKKEHKNIFLSICVAVAWVLYIILYFICGFIVVIACLLFGVSLIPHKRKRKWRF